jgi:hypothetical protein
MLTGRTLVVVMTALAASLGTFRAADDGPPVHVSPGPTPSIEHRWLDAWVVTSAETFSECNGFYTDNWLRGSQVSSHGRIDVPAGTPAHVDVVSVSESQVVFSLTVSQRLLVTREHRDFTLQAEARCQIDLKLMMPPGMSAAQDILGVESLINPVMKRYPTENAAVLAAGFLPSTDPTYASRHQTAIAQQHEFESRQTAEAIDARMSQWVSQTQRIQGRISSDPDYLAGFARGVEAGRASAVTKCEQLATAEPAMFPGGGPSTATFASKGSRQKAWSRGYEDGVQLTHGLEAIRILPQCVPGTPSASAR